MNRAHGWIVRLSVIGAGGMLFQGFTCSDPTREVVAQGVAGLLTSIINNLIAVGISELFGLSSTTTGF